MADSRGLRVRLAGRVIVLDPDDRVLLFRYDDDSLAECLDLVCNRPERAYEIAQAGFALRDDPAVRFGGFENILALARA